MNPQQHPTPQPLPALAPQTLGAYIGAFVIVISPGPVVVTGRLFGVYRAGRRWFASIAKRAFDVGVVEIRLQLRRVEGMTDAEKAEIVGLIFPGLARVDEYSAAATLESLQRAGLPLVAVDTLRARGFDCGGFDSEGKWHPSLIDAGLAVYETETLNAK